MARCQALRPSLHDLRHQFSEMTVPVLLAVGDEDVRCLETNLMLKSTLPNAGLGYAIRELGLAQDRYESALNVWGDIHEEIKARTATQ